jgi:hypothetical protein
MRRRIGSINNPRLGGMDAGYNKSMSFCFAKAQS